MYGGFLRDVMGRVGGGDQEIAYTYEILKARIHERREKLIQ